VGINHFATVGNSSSSPGDDEVNAVDGLVALLWVEIIKTPAKSGARRMGCSLMGFGRVVAFFGGLVAITLSSSVMGI